jgi:methyl-accepting chemotaxis protein
MATIALRNISVRTKIAAALGILVLIICAAGVFAIYSLLRVHGTATEIQSVWLPSVRYIGDVRYNMARHRAILARHPMVSRAEDKTQIESRLKAARDNVDEARKRYEPLIASADERAKYQAFTAAWDGYLDAVAKMLPVSSGGDNAKAMQLFVTDVSAAGLKAESTIDAIVALNLAGANAAVKAGDETYVGSRNVLVGAIAAAILFGLVAGFFLVRSVARPVIGMTDAMARLAKGDLDATIPAAGQRDEIGRMADAVQVFKQQAIENRKQAEREKVAERQAMEDRKQAILDMAQNIERETASAVSAIEANAHEVDAAAQDMSQVAASVSSDTHTVATASKQTLDNVQSVSAAAEELTGSIREISAQVARTAELGKRAVASGEAAAETFRSLTEAVGKISAVTKLIGDVASQTNLLALNATIEAARAGEAGRGFAVVASEVKELAGQTAHATEDINRQVAEIESVTKAAGGAMSEIGDRIREIDSAASAIAATIEQQGAATAEIARSVTETASATREMAARIQSVNAGADQVDGKAKHVRTSIGDIAKNIGGLREATVRVVRTSIAEADRRMAARRLINLPGEIAAGGRQAPAEVLDLSESGAQVRCDQIALRIGETAMLQVRGLTTRLPFVVRASEDGRLNIEFQLSAEADRQAYQQWFARQVEQQLAKAS